MAERLTLRQMRLGAWMRDPRGDIPSHPVINWKAACWSAADLVRLTDIYDDAPRPRALCLADLHALVAHGDVTKVGEGSTTRWRVSLPFESGVLADA